MLAGEVVLVTDTGEEILKAGDCAGFKAGEPGRPSSAKPFAADALLLEVGTRMAGDSAHYPGIDLVYPPDGIPAQYIHRDGTPYTGIRRRGPEDS